MIPLQTIRKIEKVGQTEIEFEGHEHSIKVDVKMEKVKVRESRSLGEFVIHCTDNNHRHQVYQSMKIFVSTVDAFSRGTARLGRKDLALSLAISNSTDTLSFVCPRGRERALGR